MQREILGAKLHTARVTETKIDYEGSCAIDQDLLDLAGIAPYERVHIYNITNGNRFDTYAIPDRRGSGKIGFNGAAARMGQIGDRIIIVTYVQVEDSELSKHVLRVILLDEKNRPMKNITHKTRKPK
ncbi:aspartate 1-decarboxylase [bacterium]|nr:aspartate 1-decarboxylase [bacterium]MBU1636932.1 aspartate 1-decarboxylase [bacterium]MBU1920972.1 aspartate 1-decarboxylase [bacterium]RQV93700.1 MAG: aspartate 1-decarboxylase [bacterium]